ncbi:MAG: histidine phosphatase family protein [Bacilli bacterium]|nr:histidine phosphatase family protein [Bacilli bacterium]
MMKIFLIRHGESIQNTKENYELKLPDHKVYLTEEGKKQAKQTGEFLKEYIQKNNIDINNATLWISPYERTRQTAKIINESLNIKNIKEDITLIEQRYGLFSDTEIHESKEKYPDQFKFYDNYYQNNGKFYAKLPQGEGPYDVALRTKQFLDTIFRDDADTLFVVSHGTTIKTIIMNWFHYSPEWFNSEPNMENCSVRLIESDNKQSKENYIYKGPIKK